MEAVVEQIIKKRTYGTLSEEERNVVQEWCGSEEEFVQMKQFLLEVDGLAASMRTAPNTEIKKSLDSIFAAKHGGIRANWTSPAEAVAAPVQAPVIPLYQRTWVRAAAVALLVLGTVPFWNLADHEVAHKSQEPVAKLEEPAAPAGTAQDVATKSKAPVAQPAVNGTIEQENAAVADESEIYSALAFKTIAEPSFSAEGYASEDKTDADQQNRELEWNGVNEELGAMTKVSATAGSYSFTTAGMNADLNPYNKDMAGVSAVSMAAQPDELFDFIVPAF